MPKSKALVPTVRSKMKRVGATQAQVASACGLSQAHLSRVLAEKLPLAPKTETRLRAWLADEGNSRDELTAVIDRIVAVDERRRGKILAVLRAIESAMA